MDKIFILIIEFYRKRLSKLKGHPTCRFVPTCSGYAIDAIREWGAACGLVMTVWRIIRCNPICKCGFEPVSANRRKQKRIAKRFIHKTGLDKF